jgi:hypothetical protein
VVRAALPEAIRGRIAIALREMHRDAEMRHALAASGVLRFAPVSPNDYGVVPALQVA